jgi:hypothetical protein
VKEIAMTLATLPLYQCRVKCGTQPEHRNVEDGGGAWPGSMFVGYPMYPSELIENDQLTIRCYVY